MDEKDMAARAAPASVLRQRAADSKQEDLRRVRWQYLSVLQKTDAATEQRDYNTVFKNAKKELLEVYKLNEESATEGARQVVRLLKETDGNMRAQREYIERALELDDR